MNPTFAFLLLLTSHFVADFVCQNDWMAHGKSKRLLPLVTHVFVYSLVMVPVFGYVCVQLAPPREPYSTGLLIFGIVGFTFVLVGFPHFVVDFCTSRLNSWLLPRDPEGNISLTESWHNFFVGVGFDQLIHAWCLGGLVWVLSGSVL